MIGILNAVWFLLPAAMQLTLLIVMIRRRLYRRGLFTWFFTYSLYSVLVTLPRLILLYRSHHYTTFYWITDMVYGLLALLSLNEVFGRIFFLDYEEHSWVRLVFPTVVLGIVSGLFVWWRFIQQAPSGGHFDSWSAARLAFNFGVHSIEGILMGLFLLLWWALVPGWNRYDYGVLVGFGVSAAVTMAARIARLYSGPSPVGWYKFAPGIGYVLATLIWLHAFWKAPELRVTPRLRFQEILEHAQQNNAMIRLVHQWLHRRRV